MPQFPGGFQAGAHMFTYGPYDDIVLADAPDAYWPLDAEVDFAETDYDTLVLSHSPVAYWPLDAIVSSVFEDSVGSKDLTITTTTDWSVNSGVMPNGDNASSSNATTLNSNAEWTTEDFTLPNGSGSEARTLEFWIDVDATNATDQTIFTVRTNGTSTGTTNRHIRVNIVSGQMSTRWYNTSAGNYMLSSTTLTTGWHHVVIVWSCGSTKETRYYIDGIRGGGTTTTSGTPTTAASNTYVTYVGASRTNATEELTRNLGKVAWWDRALTTNEIAQHYLAMVE